MTSLLQTDLRSLIGHAGKPCISMYLPTHRGGQDSRQDPIRFKNLLRRAEGLLVGQGIRKPEAASLLEPARRLVDDPDFWRHQGEGLAVFLAPGRFSQYRLPRTAEELVVVTDHFDIKPLLPMFWQQQRFFVLALSLNSRCLLSCWADQVVEVPLKDVPESLEDALKYDVVNKQMQWHTRTAPAAGRGRRTPISFGSATATDEAVKKRNIWQYCQAVAKGVEAALATEKAPLVLAGVDSLHPILRECLSYEPVLAEGVTGNPDRWTPQEIRDQAWRIVGAHFDRARQNALSTYGMVSARDLASSSLEQIVPAAYEGRVEMLFVPTSQPRWGRYDASSRRIELHAKAEPGDEDLLDFAAVHTLLHHGAVFSLEPDHMPAAAEAAAVLRPGGNHYET